MAGLDRSIFRERAIERYIQRQELNVILRLVSPPMFLLLWFLLLLAVCCSVMVWTIQVPMLVVGKGAVVQQPKANTKNVQEIVVLLVLPPEQKANLKIGQPVTISVASTDMKFESTIESIEANTMSPADISARISTQSTLARDITGPSVVAIAQVVPASQAHIYLGSQCSVQVEIGTQSALSLIPGFDGVASYFSDLPAHFSGWFRFFDAILR